MGYFISYDNLFSTWLSKGRDFSVQDVRDALSAFSRLINTTHKKVFEGVFDTLQTGLSKLGDSSASQSKANVSVSGYYDVFSIDDDKCSGFWNSYFKTPIAMKIFDNAATGSLIEKRRVKYSTLQHLDFYMPRELSEKIKIGRYMDALDNLITLHQRESTYFTGGFYAE